MLRNKFDPTQPLSYIRYGRMSDPGQNPRSPDQQFTTIYETLVRLRFTHWRHLDDFRDDAISGRYQRKREDFQRMKQAIMTGLIKPDLILVDTLERFGRMKELAELRRQLQNRYGVLILSANTNFADPTSTQGRVYGAVEAIRASEEADTKAHNVLRGKRDAVLLKRWPGGPPPFGSRLKKFVETVRGRDMTYSILIREAESAWIVELAFQIAMETGWGQTRVARALNEDQRIPEMYKPFHAATIGEWFQNELYIGVMVFPKLATDVVDDTRVVEAVPPEEQLRIDDYCEAIVPRDVFLPVFETRRRRAAAAKACRAASTVNDSKIVKPPVPGLTLNYLLTGLVRCGRCKLAMTPNGGSSYTTKTGEVHRYVAYQCPASGEGVCPNETRIPEEWLRRVVVDTLKMRLFPGI